jgi:TonB family protein
LKEHEINTIYTAEDIEKYFSGKLLPAQMHAMEKAALDDPFFAEAMEGYGAMKSDTWKKELIDIKEKFKERKDDDTLVVPINKSFKWWKAAAAILIIGSGGWLTYLFTNSNSIKNKTVAVTTVKKDSADTSSIAAVKPDLLSPAETTSATKNNEQPLIAQVKTIPDSIHRFTDRSTKSSKVRVIKNTADADDQKQYENETAATIASAPVQDNAAAGYAKEPGKAVLKNNELATDKLTDKKEAAFNRIFVAEVLGADNAPLPFANIYIPNENIGTYADVKGRFRLLSSDSVLNIRVRAAGYLPRTFLLNSNVTQNTILLNEQQVATEDIVKFNSKAKKNITASRNAILFDTVLNVEPADGWNNYGVYLDNNLFPSEEIVQKNIHGEVEVSFDVLSNGAVSNVNIAKSLCSDCDKEALRVIKEGPQWKVKNGKKDKGKVKIKF